MAFWVVYLALGVTLAVLMWRERPDWVRAKPFFERASLAFVIVWAWPILLIQDWLDGGEV